MAVGSQAGTPPRPDATYPLIGTLVAAAAVAALAMTMFVPSIPSLARSFGVAEAKMQLGLSVFLATTAIVQLVCGPLSDLYGRRPVLAAAMGLFCVGTAMCLVAPSVGWFLAGRVVQGAAAAGMVLSRTIIRDLYGRDRAASMIGYTVMAMAVAPMIGPWIGGMLDEAAGWTATFWVLAAIGLATLMLIVLRLPETNGTLGRPLGSQLDAYRDLLGTRDFWVFAATGSAASAIFFSFLGGASQVAANALRMSPSHYGAWFAFCAAGYVFGNFLSGRYAERVGLGPMIVAGATIGLIGPLAIVVSAWVGWGHPFALFGWIAFVGVGNGMVLPSNIAAAVSVRPDAAGAASGLVGTVQTMTGAVASAFAAWAVADGAALMPLGLTLLGFAVPAVALALASRPAIERQG